MGDVVREGGGFEDREGICGMGLNRERHEAREKEKAEEKFVRQAHLTPVLSPRPTGGEGEALGRVL